MVYILLGICIGGILFGVSAVAYIEPGSAGDPLVTKSYVDRHARVRLVTVAAGKYVVPELGTELILRAGSAKVAAGPGGGFADLTVGGELEGQGSVKKNHLLLTPRADGRGLRVESQSIFIIRGGFEIVNQEDFQSGWE